jgi:hypothetical protein
MLRTIVRSITFPQDLPFLIMQSNSSLYNRPPLTGTPNTSQALPPNICLAGSAKQNESGYMESIHHVLDGIRYFYAPKVFSMNNLCMNPRNGAIPVPVAIMITSFVGSLGRSIVFPTGPATMTSSPGRTSHRKLEQTPFFAGSFCPVTGSKYSARLTHRLMVLPSNRSP